MVPPTQHPQSEYFLGNHLKRTADSPSTTHHRPSKKQKPTQKSLTKEQEEISKQSVASDGSDASSNVGIMLQPVETLRGDVPFTNAEAFRIRGWYWEWSRKDEGGGDGVLESPRGTRYHL
jgi:hypothetical protein